MQLNEHPDKYALMETAFTISRGENEGEYMRDLNPKYQAEIKKMAEALSAARK